MLSVELGHLASMLDEVQQLKNVSKLAKGYSSTIKKAIWNHTVRRDPLDLFDVYS